MAGIKVIVPPAIEPVTIQEVALQLRYDDDMLTPEISGSIADSITAAREWCEGYQNRAYVTQTLELALDRWPCGRAIELPRPPLQAVESVVYVDQDNVSSTWPNTEYIVDDYAFVSQIVRKMAWPPGKLAAVNGIRVRYVAGSPPVPGQVATGESLGSGDGEEHTYTVAHAPVEPDSLTVYFDGVTTTAFTVDYESGEITCTPGDGVAVTVDYTQTDDYRGNVPQRARQAITLLAAHWYDNGQCEPPSAVYALLDLDRVVPL